MMTQMRVAENHHPAWKQAEAGRLLYQRCRDGRWFGPGLLLVIVVLFYWKLTFTNQFTWLESPDITNQVLPWFQFQAGEWHARHFPLWDPTSWGGQPLFGQAQPGSAYPFNWLLFLMPLKHGWIRDLALRWYFVIIHYLGALACYALCRDLGRSRTASVTASTVFALGGYVANTDWPQMLNGAIWAPLVFLYLFRTERGERPLASALLSGFFLGVAWLSGHHQIPIFLSIATAAVWAWICLRGGRPDWRLARLAVLSLGLAVLASGLQTLPTAEYGRRSVRWSAGETPLRFDQPVPYHVHEEYALKPIALLSVFVPSVAPAWNPFIGVAAFTLAILGVILAWRERQVRWLGSVALAGLLFALGPNSLLHGILYSLIPLVEKARSPAAATGIFALGIAPLVAFDIDRLAVPKSSFWSRRAGWILVGFGAFLSLATLLFFATRVPVWISDDRLMITAFCAIALAALLAGWRSGGLSARGASAAILLLVLFELANVSNYWMGEYGVTPARDALLQQMTQHSDLVNYVRSRGIAARVEYDDKAIPYNIGDWYGVETFNGYLVSVTENLWQHNLFSQHVKDFFGVRYYFGKTSQRPDQKQVFQSQNGLSVFENPGAYPRVWAVHRASRVDGPTQAQATLSDANFDARSTVFMEGEAAPRLAVCDEAEDAIDLPRHEANRVVISADMGCRGMVILTDTWFPGWHATVDGKPAKIEQAYGAVRGVVVDGGRHTIIMRYRPASVIVGAAMSLLAAGIVFLIGWRTRRELPGPAGPASS